MVDSSHQSLVQDFKEDVGRIEDGNPWLLASWMIGVYRSVQLEGLRSME